jgi:DNA-binding response OmpR family regulator
MMHILFVEDDATIASGLVYALETEHFTVTHCPDEKSALHALAGQTFSLALLDLSLPDGSGFAVLEQIRRMSSDIPVLFLTAADDEGNTVKALERGADDYITKPFRVRELLARIRAALRRVSAGDVIALGPVKVETARAKVYRDGAEVLLTALEYRLLLTFASHKGQVLTRGQILESLWDVAGNFVNDNTLTVYIKRLREKLGEDIVQTVRGLGYKAGD